MKKIFEKIFTGRKEEFNNQIFNDLKDDKKRFIITANPETFVLGYNNHDFKNILLNNSTTIVPDGISIVKAGNKLGYNIKERISGIDISNILLSYANELKKSIFIFGSTDEVLNLVRENIFKKHPNINILGASNGYVEDKNRVVDEIAKLKPDIILVGLGVPLQEELVFNSLNKFKKGIFIGVGGALDVISGKKKRAPEFFIKYNIEWLYRIIQEPVRIKRFFKYNIRFLFILRKNKKEFRKCLE